VCIIHCISYIQWKYKICDEPIMWFVLELSQELMSQQSMKLSSMTIQIMSLHDAQMAFQPHEVETNLPPV